MFKNLSTKCCHTLIAFTLFAGLSAVDASATDAKQVALNVGVSNPMMLAGDKQTNYVRIALTGFNLPKTEQRPPVNVAIVIDTSGSMGGTKINQARKAAIAAVNRLQDDDIISVVLYSSSVQVLVPATKATDRAQIIHKIKSVKAGGSTALFAGVSKGAAEVRKFRNDEYVNRVILLSDGLANIGPKSPRELERLGGTLVKEGISVSTMGLGLGYNEDLMSKLAVAGSGNHVFVEAAEDLIAVFNREFNNLMSVVASDFEIIAKVPEGVRPVRVVGTKADFSGREVSIPLAQLYAKQERYFIVEVEVDKSETGESRSLADVSIQYTNMISDTKDKLSSNVSVNFTDDPKLVEKNTDFVTYASCCVQLANERNCRATELRDAGQIEEARLLLLTNDKELKVAAFRCASNGSSSVVPELKRNAALNFEQASEIGDEKLWAGNRKAMRAEQAGNSAQQTYSTSPSRGGRRGR